MRVVVVGATGNVGTSTVAALAGDPAVEEIVGVARRKPERAFPKVRWVAADIRSSDLVETFRGASVVIHLAWLIQPSRDRDELRSVNVDGGARLFRAVAEAGVSGYVFDSWFGLLAPATLIHWVRTVWIEAAAGAVSGTKSILQTMYTLAACPTRSWSMSLTSQ